MNPNDNAKSKGGRKKKASKGTLIDHTYYDFSTRELSELLPDEADSDEKPRGRVTFPMKLHAILSSPNYQHIIRWMPHGRSWKILDNDMLASVVCPENFNHSSYDSFNRSVNGWGFKRLMKHGLDHKSYYHELFLRGRPELTAAMVRLDRPGKRIPDPEGEPNFYRIAELYPLPLDPALPADPGDVLVASNHDSENFINEDAEAFDNRKKSSAASHGDSPCKGSLRSNHESPCQMASTAPYAQAPTLHHDHPDQHMRKRQRHERHSYPPYGYFNHPGHQPEYYHGHYSPHPYALNNSPYGYNANYPHPHFQNPYTSPERHHYHQHNHLGSMHPQAYPSHEASQGNNSGYNGYNQHPWPQGYHNSYGNYSAFKRGSTAAAGPRPGDYQDQNVWNNEHVMNQSIDYTETISACDGSQTYKSSLGDIRSETKSSEEQHQHLKSKPTKYIISAAGLQPLEDDNATIAELDERKPSSKDSSNNE